MSDISHDRPCVSRATILRPVPAGDTGTPAPGRARARAEGRTRNRVCFRSQVAGPGGHLEVLFDRLLTPKEWDVALY